MALKHSPEQGVPEVCGLETPLPIRNGALWTLYSQAHLFSATFTSATLWTLFDMVEEEWRSRLEFTQHIFLFFLFWECL